MKPEFNEWFLKNLVYCEDTHSFTHRLFELMEDCDYKKRQYQANKIIDEMYKEWEMI